jgi:hypothetical protein
MEGNAKICFDIIQEVNSVLGLFQPIKKIISEVRKSFVWDAWSKYMFWTLLFK